MSHRLAVASFLVVLAFGAAGCAPLLEVKPVGNVTLDPPAETSTVVAADGSVLAELHAEQDRDLVPLDEIPQILRDAVLAVEDARFYSHSGVDARAIARAVVANARDGQVSQGGSTITQQLAKNAVTGAERSLRRKLEEASVALQLESQLSKDEILSRYLNTVYFGDGAYGVQTAARHYFDRDVGEVTLPQAALLAGLLKAPSTYDPFSDPEAARRRRDVVLGRMEHLELVSPEQAATARQASLGVVAPTGDEWQAPYFVGEVLEQVQHNPAFAVLGAAPADRADRLFRGGLRIETTLDPHWQRAAEQAVADTLTDPADPRGAVAAIDPSSGAVRALVGGRGYYDEDDPIARFNLATDARRQPGSTFKSLVLATALAQGHSLDDVYEAPATITIPPDPPQEPTPWRVRNYTDVDFGELSLREATAFSVNAVYAQLIAEVGPAAVAETARQAGIGQPLLPYRSLALGAQEVTVLSMASVQATLAAGGVYRPPSFVTRIVDPDGDVLYERGTVSGERVIDGAVAWLTTTALQEVVDRGTGVRADIHRPLAGKTGTTQDGADAWFTGYTPDLAAAVWIGFHEGLVPMEPPRTRIRVEGGNWPAELFARFAIRALDDVPAHEFPAPDVALTRLEVDTSRNCLPNPYTPPDVVAKRAYLAGTEPTEVCQEPTGPPTTDVPDALGLPLSAAQRLLTGAGFVITERAEFSVELPPGYVVRQSPSPGAGQTLDDGYAVTVWVSSADRADAEVPDVLATGLRRARRALEEAGFVVEVTRGCPDGARRCTGAVERPGTVWEQAPEAGSRVPVHSVVRLSVYPKP